MVELPKVLRLVGVPGLGPRRIMNLVRYFKNIDTIFNAGLSELCQVPGIDLSLAKIIVNADTSDFVNTQLLLLKKYPFKVLSIFDEQYPERLKNIYDPPILLYYLGEFDPNDLDSIAVVGTRTPSNYGKSVTAHLVKELVEQHITVVSGFARGIDTIAHRTAAQSGGRTIAVLGNGIDRVYPTENRDLKNLIVQNGVYCTEFPIGTKPDAVNFPRRNRIISGLSLGVLVIEAGEKSGATLTAYYANDQNREVFAIPGRIGDSRSIGTNRLIQKGAKLVLDVDDILLEIESLRKFHRRPVQLDIDFHLDGEEKVVFDVLSNEPINIDKLAATINKSPFEILPILLNLEIKGCVRQLAGKMFVRA
ncbi:MAG: DNA-processing protein DprA [Fidelibacterota bacterium]